MFAIASMVTFWVYAIEEYSQALSNSSISELLYILYVHKKEYSSTNHGNSDNCID